MSARQARPVWMFGAPATGVFFLAYRGLAHGLPSPARRFPIMPARPLVVEEGSLPPPQISRGPQRAIRPSSGAILDLLALSTRRLRTGWYGIPRQSGGEQRCPSDRDPKSSVADGQKNPRSRKGKVGGVHERLFSGEDRTGIFAARAWVARLADWCLRTGCRRHLQPPPREPAAGPRRAARARRGSSPRATPETARSRR